MLSMINHATQMFRMKGIQHIILLSKVPVAFKPSRKAIQDNWLSKMNLYWWHQESHTPSSGLACYKILHVERKGFSFEKVLFDVSCSGFMEGTVKTKSQIHIESLQIGSAAKGSLRKEDAAFVCVEAVNAVPQIGFTFEVVNGGEKISDWKECLS